MSIHTAPPPPAVAGQMGPLANESVVDVWTIAHGGAGFIAGTYRVGWLAALSGALALEAVEIGLSSRWPDLANESKRNMIMDLAAFVVAYQIGTLS